jgi:hypothetical protein
MVVYYFLVLLQQQRQNNFCYASVTNYIIYHFTKEALS